MENNNYPIELSKSFREMSTDIVKVLVDTKLLDGIIKDLVGY